MHNNPYDICTAYSSLQQVGVFWWDRHHCICAAYQGRRWIAAADSTVAQHADDTREAFMLSSTGHTC